MDQVHLWRCALPTNPPSSFETSLARLQLPRFNSAFLCCCFSGCFCILMHFLLIRFNSFFDAFSFWYPAPKKADDLEVEVQFSEVSSEHLVLLRESHTKAAASSSSETLHAYETLEAELFMPKEVTSQARQLWLVNCYEKSQRKKVGQTR